MFTLWLSDKLLLCLIKVNANTCKSTYILFSMMSSLELLVRLDWQDLIWFYPSLGSVIQKTLNERLEEITNWSSENTEEEESARPLINCTELESKSGFYVKTVVETLQPVVWGERANMSWSLWNPNVTKIKTLITGNDMVLFVVFKGWSPARP